MKTLLLSILASVASAASVFAGPYAPAAGQANSTAISAGSTSFHGWATGVVDLTRGPQDISDPESDVASFGVAESALGKSDATTDAPLSVVSLGDGGSITLSFTAPITNGTGADFAVFENGFADNFLELAFVEVSSDGNNFFRFPSHSLTQTTTQVGTFGTLDPTNIDGLAGKYRAGFGTPFDLAQLAFVSPLLDVNAITMVRIVDVVGSIDPAYGTKDSDGHMINDPWPTGFPSSGFDLDAVGVLNQLPEPGTPVLAAIAAALLSLRRAPRERDARKQPCTRNREKGFTVIELLVVITIIAVLSTLAMKAVTTVSQRAEATQCASNLRQLAAANGSYAAEHGGQFVPAQEPSNLIRWHGARDSVSQAFDPAKGPLAPYLGLSGKVKLCPTFRNALTDKETFEQGSGGYGYNEIYIGGTPADAFTAERIANVPEPARTIMFSDTALARADGVQEYPFCEPWQYVSTTGKLMGPLAASMHFRHNGKANVAWCDGHVTAEAYTVLDGKNIYWGDEKKFTLGWFGSSVNNGYWHP